MAELETKQFPSEFEDISSEADKILGSKPDGTPGFVRVSALEKVGPAGPVGPASTVPGPIGPVGPTGITTPNIQTNKLAGRITPEVGSVEALEPVGLTLADGKVIVDYSNLELGGRNYIRGTGQREGYIDYISGNFASASTDYYVSGFAPVFEGQKMTLSRSNLNLNLDMNAAFYTSVSEDAMLVYWGVATGKTFKLSENETFTVPVGAKFIRTTIAISQYPIKLEKGNKASDWTPAPEDLNNLTNPITGFNPASGVNTPLTAEMTLLQSLQNLEKQGESKSKIEATAVAGTTTAIQFDKERRYGSNAAPITAAAITTNSTDAKFEVTAKLYIQRATAPTFPATWKLTSGGATWSATKVNRVYAQYEDASNIYYVITND